MAITTFSLPVDIPWQRIAFSQDMMDSVACDRELPLRWRSSVAVFAYQPPEEQQRTDGFIVSYLKVACTITGFQADGKEIRIREQLGRSGWKDADLTDLLTELASRYYPCHGAILEVVVAPHADDRRFTLAQYPYFADFDPKKRELYEVVTETGETMSRSLEDVGVRLGQTTLASHEVRDNTTLGAGLSASYMGITASGNVSNESGTVDISTHGTENIRTSDAAREARETFSHTTQLSQMYHQLDSYHLGTNRVAFFVLPRPHIVQSPATFVNGPREIEGVQEFMLVVVRPKAMEEFCVEAYLETAHLTGRLIPDWDPTDTLLAFKVDSPDNTIRTNSVSTPGRTGYVIDRDRGPKGGPLGHGDTGGYQLLSVDQDNIPRLEGPGSLTSDYTFIVGNEQVTVNGWVMGWPGRGNRSTVGGTLEVLATVFLKKKTPTLAGRERGLMITGRAVCSCARSLVADLKSMGPSVVYEKSLGKDDTQVTPGQNSMSVQEANRLGAELKRELLQSLSSADRYPRGAVSFLDSQLVAEPMGAHLRHADANVNPPIVQWSGIDQSLAGRVAAYAPWITRAQLLEMPLARQVENFGLTFAEAVELRRSLTDIAEPDGPPPVPERSYVQVPLLTGLTTSEGQSVLARTGLSMGAVTVEDSPLPSNTILGHQPEAGAPVEPGSAVSARVASGLTVRLPELAGLRLSEALCRLREAGLRSEPSVEGKPGPDAELVELQPEAGTLVTPETAVTVRLTRRRRGRD